MADPGDAVVAAALDGGLTGLAAAYAAGVTPEAVAEEVLARISAADDPAVWIDVESADDLRRAAAALGPGPVPGLALWGVPFGVKDNIDVADRVTTGALPGRARTAGRSATVVARLQAAGALYVGKTNLDQLATGLVGTRSPYGTPRNPFDPALVPGGSSSGSAVAVARRQVAFALGTDTAGSGRVPAALCGVVGAKGLPGSRPLDGVMPASPSIDCVSTFATSVADALAVEAVTAGRIWPLAIGPLRVATAGPGIAGGVLARLRASGHAVVDVDPAPFHEAGDLLYGGSWLADRTAALAPLLAGEPAGLDPVVASVVAGGLAYSGVDVFTAQRRLRTLRAELAGWWRDHDVLVVSTVLHVPSLAEVAADPRATNVALGRNTTFANLLGLAAIAVPDPTGPGGVTVLGPAGHLGAVAAIAASVAGEDLAGGALGEAGRPGGHPVAVVGAHLQGQPLNHELVDRGGELVSRTTTAPCYRLYRLDGGPPLRPALERVSGAGAAIEVEVWMLDDAGLGALVGGVARPLGIGSVELADGRWVKGFICEPAGLVGALDITEHGGWRRYLEADGAG